MLSRQELIEANTLYHTWGYKQTHRCPVCGSDMVKRRPKATQSYGQKPDFMGCAKFPECCGARFQSGTPTFNKFSLDKWRSYQASGKSKTFSSVSDDERDQVEQEQKRVAGMSPSERRFFEIVE